MRQWKVLLVFPGPELGGAERQGMHLARYLKRRGCNVYVWSTLPGEGRVVEECAAEKIPWEAHRFLWPCRKSSLVRDGWRLIRALRKLRPDVILSYTSSPNVGCGLFWRFSRAKACVWGQRNIDDLRGDGVERLAYRRVSAVICNAAHEKEYLKKTLREPTVPLHVIHNGLDLASPEKPRQAWRAELGIDPEALVAVMLANFRPQKDHATLLHAWAMMNAQIENTGRPRPCLVLAGAPQFTFDEVKRLAGDLGVLETVRFPGQVHDVSGLLAAADIGVLISQREGLSNSILEYMSAGLPVVATDLPGNREAIGNASQFSFCRKRNANDIADKFIELIHDKSLRKRLGALSQKRAIEEFSIESMCMKTELILCDLVCDGEIERIHAGY